MRAAVALAFGPVLYAELRLRGLRYPSLVAANVVVLLLTLVVGPR